MPDHSQAEDFKTTKAHRNAKFTQPIVPSAQEEEEVEKLKHALEEEKARSKQCLDQLKYLQADFENSMKRLRREADEAARIANEQIIVKIMDVAENLERAIEVGQKITENSELTAGVKMISKQLGEILRQEGLEAIPAEGQQFDPTLHEAVAQTETTEKPDGAIIKELRRGYKLKGKVLRASKVEVTRAPKNEPDQSSE